MHIYLVRHTKYHNPENIFPFHLPVYLSVEGRAHAQRIAKWFEEKKITDVPIYSSPIVRCVQTAEIIAAKTQSFVMTDGRLVETFSPQAQGKVQPAQDPWKAELADPDRESQASIQDRAVDIFDEKVKLGEDVILVSHGDPLTILYFYLNNDALPEELWSPAYEDKVIERGEIVDVEVENGKVVGMSRFKV